jgi:hypothetical protein
LSLIVVRENDRIAFYQGLHNFGILVREGINAVNIFIPIKKLK